MEVQEVQPDCYILSIHVRVNELKISHGEMTKTLT